MNHLVLFYHWLCVFSQVNSLLKDVDQLINSFTVALKKLLSKLNR